MSYPAYPEYKDSGVEWLGEVPVHWEVLPLRRVSITVQTGSTPSIEQPSEDIEDGLSWFTPGDFGKALVLDRARKKINDKAIISGEAKVFPSNSIYLVGIGATLGKVGYCGTTASANQQINVIVPDHNIYGYFLAHSLSPESVRPAPGSTSNPLTCMAI